VVVLGLVGLVGLLGLVVLLPLELMPLELGEELLLPLELGELLLPLDDPLLLPLVAPPLLLPLEELDLLKYASHSERDTCPSLFVSTVEKVGAMLLDELLPPKLLPLEALPPLDIPEDPDEPDEPVALGDLSVLELEDELCAIDTLAIAKRAAAVAVLTIFNIWRFLLHKRIKVGTALGRGARSMPGTTLPSVVRQRSSIQLQIGAAATLAAAAYVHQRAWQAARQPAGRKVHRGARRSPALHGARRRSAAPHAAWARQHGAGACPERAVRARGRPLPRHRAGPARLRVQPAAAHQMVGTAGAGGAAPPDARADGNRTAGALRPLIRRDRRDRLRARVSHLGARLVLASGYYFPSGRLELPFDVPPAIPVIGDLMRHTISPLIGRLMWSGRLKLMFAPAPVPRYFGRFPVWMTLRPTPLRAAAEEAALLIPSALALKRKYGALQTPAVILAGAQDRYVDHRRHSAALHALVPGSELLLSTRAGHMVHHVDPRRALQAIEAAAR
jgi:hypothetical protein